MNLLFGRDAEVAHWVALRIPNVGSGLLFGPCAAIGVADDDGNVGAGAVYHGYQERFGGIEISFALDHPRYLTRTMISGLLSYPFGQLGCVRVTACTPRLATSVRTFLETLGFKREGLVRRGFGRDDAVIYGLLAKEWARSPFNLNRRRDVPALPVARRVSRVQEGRLLSTPGA